MAGPENCRGHPLLLRAAQEPPVAPVPPLARPRPGSSGYLCLRGEATQPASVPSARNTAPSAHRSAKASSSCRAQFTHRLLLAALPDRLLRPSQCNYPSSCGSLLLETRAQEAVTEGACHHCPSTRWLTLNMCSINQTSGEGDQNPKELISGTFSTWAPNPIRETGEQKVVLNAEQGTSQPHVLL